MQELDKSVPTQLLVRLLATATGAGKPGILFGSVTAYLLKTGGANTVFAITALNWHEVDAVGSPGSYLVDLTATNTDTSGLLVMSLTVATCDVAIITAKVKSVATASVSYQQVDLTLASATLSGGARIALAGGGLPDRITTKDCTAITPASGPGPLLLGSESLLYVADAAMRIERWDLPAAAFTWSVASGALLVRGLGYDAALNELYVACGTNNRIYVLNGTTGAAIRSWACVVAPMSVSVLATDLIWVSPTSAGNCTEYDRNGVATGRTIAVTSSRGSYAEGAYLYVNVSQTTRYPVAGGAGVAFGFGWSASGITGDGTYLYRSPLYVVADAYTYALAPVSRVVLPYPAVEQVTNTYNNISAFGTRLVYLDFVNSVTVVRSVHRLTASALWASACAFVSNAVITSVSVPGDLGRTFNGTENFRRTRLYYSIDGTPPSIEISPNEPLAISVTAGQTLQIKATMSTWGMPASAEPWIGGTSGEGPTIYFLNNASASIRVPVRMLRSDNGQGKTGLVFGDISCYIQKQGGVSTAKTIDGTNWFEIDAVNMPGKYDILMSAADLNTPGILTYFVRAALCEDYPGTYTVPDSVADNTYDQLTLVAADVAATHIHAAGAETQATTAAVQSTTAAAQSTIAATQSTNAAADALAAHAHAAGAETQATTAAAQSTIAATQSTNAAADALTIKGKLPATTIAAAADVTAAVTAIEGIGAHTIGDIYANTSLLPSDPADQSAVEAAITAAVVAIEGVGSHTIGDIYASTSLLPSDPADQSAVEAAITAAVTTIEGAGAHSIADIYANTSLLPSDPADQSAVEAAITASQAAIVGASPVSLTTLDNGLSSISLATGKLSGLLHENSIIDMQTWSGTNMLSCRVRCYDSKTNADAAGVTGLLYTYSVTAHYSLGKLDSYKMTLEP